MLMCNIPIRLPTYVRTRDFGKAGTTAATATAIVTEFSSVARVCSPPNAARRTKECHPTWREIPRYYDKNLHFRLSYSSTLSFQGNNTLRTIYVSIFANFSRLLLQILRILTSTDGYPLIRIFEIEIVLRVNIRSPESEYPDNSLLGTRILSFALTTNIKDVLNFYIKNFCKYFFQIGYSVT